MLFTHVGIAYLDSLIDHEEFHTFGGDLLFLVRYTHTHKYTYNVCMYVFMYVCMYACMYISAWYIILHYCYRILAVSCLKTEQHGSSMDKLEVSISTEILKLYRKVSMHIYTINIIFILLCYLPLTCAYFIYPISSWPMSGCSHLALT